MHPPMPVIIGAPRSGTTLLRFMLDSHPDVAIPPETGFLVIGAALEGEGDELRRSFFDVVTAFPPDAPAWNDFGIKKDLFWSKLLEIAPFSIAEGFRAFYRTYAARFEKPRWGDKTPLHGLSLTAIADALPEAHFIHVIRDGRDVALSLRQMWFSPGDRIEDLAAYWTQCVSTAREQGLRYDRYVEVRFEELVRDTRAVLRSLCTSLRLSYADQMLDYHIRSPARLREHGDRLRADGSLIVSHSGRLRQQVSRVHSWTQQMGKEEQRRFEAIAGRLLVDLGYGDLA